MRPVCPYGPRLLSKNLFVLKVVRNLPVTRIRNLPQNPGVRCMQPYTHELHPTSRPNPSTCVILLSVRLWVQLL